MILKYFFQSPGAGNEGTITFVLYLKENEQRHKVYCRYSVNEDQQTAIENAAKWGNSATWVPTDTSEWLPYTRSSLDTTTDS